METREINRHFRGEGRFLGTFPRDLLPANPGRSRGLIINLDESTESGSHWVAIYFDDNGKADYFDSFGLPPLTLEIKKFLSENAPRGWIFNDQCFQSLSSNTCGAYCILFLKLRFKDIPFEQIKLLFCEKTFINDLIIKDYVE